MPRRPTLVCVPLFICGTLLNTTVFPAAGKKAAEKTDPAVSAVEKVLRAEVAGEVDRRERLADALREFPGSSAARWQSGFVRDGNQWQSFDEMSPSTAESVVLKEYRARRQETSQTSAGQLDLANWCKKQGLADQERAHLTASLGLSPGKEDAALLLRLGYQRIGTQWLSPEQLQDWQRSNRRTEASLKKWSAKLERIAERLSASNAHRAAAAADLRGMNDVSAVPAIELILTGRDRETAIVAVDAFQRFDGYEATLALAKQGVFSQWPEVRKAAAVALKGRRLEDFVPPLIDLLAIPSAGQFGFYHDPSRGTLAYSYIMAVETDDQFQVSTLDVVNQVIDARTGESLASPRRRRYANPLSDQAALATANADAVRSLADRLYGRERELEATNDRMRDLNDRVIGVLADVSGKEPTQKVRQWWQWWSDHTDSQSGYEKPLVVVENEYETSETPVSFYVAPLSARHHECFAAGTPVRTNRGMLPIEKIQVGDRVLAQDVETGELAYKPVLQTTIRPPKELCTLRLGDETIVCTGGHRFWTSGSGWVKARDLEPQALLHSVTGNVPVRTSRKGETAKTYNLVVADFHTYFIGSAGLLSQDLLIPKSTDNLVPGLSRANAVAQTKK